LDSVESVAFTHARIKWQLDASPNDLMFIIPEQGGEKKKGEGKIS